MLFASNIEYFFLCGKAREEAHERRRDAEVPREGAGDCLVRLSAYRRFPDGDDVPPVIDLLNGLLPRPRLCVNDDFHNGCGTVLYSAMNIHSAFLLSLLTALSIGVIPTVYATTGCNAVGWNERHGVVGCNLYYPAIHWLYEEGIASGDAATGTFFPEHTINRAEFTKLVLLASGVKNPPACSAAPFPDVPKTAWFASYVCAAKDKGIISGFPDGTFKPAINVNFANGAKILAKTFNVPVDPHDANLGGQGFSDQPSIWYRPYTLGLLRQRAVAPTVQAFTQSLTRGEMAEMLYRLATGKNYFDEPMPTGDGDYLGYGLGPYDLEQSFGIDISENPDPPYVFSSNERKVTGVFSKDMLLKGYGFSHVLQRERCTLSGLWEHCKPTFADWTIELYSVPSVVTFSQEYSEIGGFKRRSFGGKPGNCLILGVEGENTEYCVVSLGKKTFIVIREYIDTNAMGVPEAMPLEKSDAIYAKIRKSIRFLQ